MPRIPLAIAVSPLVLALSITASAQEDLDFTWYSFAQLTAERLGESGDEFSFGADRIKTRLELSRQKLTGGMLIELGAEDLAEEAPGALANVVADLYGNYQVTPRQVFRIGQFKVPVGMDYNTSGQSLDITKRGMEAGLALNRTLGVMVSGRNVWNGFGYDVGVFNPAGRSLATQYVDSQVDEDKAAAVRLHWDASRWHAEAAYGRSQNAGGPATEDYRVTDAAVSLRLDRWKIKAEWIEGREVRGLAGWTERVYFLHGGYQLRPNLEVVARLYNGKSRVAGAATDLTNGYLGVTVHIIETERFDGRLQLNYVTAGGDEARYSGVFGYRDDAILIQFQIYAQK